VANAILDGTDAVMLSGETAIGQYPIQAAQMMETIAAKAEAHLPRDRWASLMTAGPGVDGVYSPTQAISKVTVEVALSVGARAIVTSTVSGTTARMVARHRPSVPVLAATPSEETLHRLALVWGVQPVLVGDFTSTDEMIRLTVDAACKSGIASWGDTIVITAGIPFGGRGNTNFLKVHTVGELEEI
jgi:pyruvate kinase